MPVDPETLGARLFTAGFDQVEVEQLMVFSDRGALLATTTPSGPNEKERADDLALRRALIVRDPATV